MSNRKESIKKSLGLTEYPWSSDDEDTPNINNEAAGPTGRRAAERAEQSQQHSSSSAPGTSAGQPLPSSSLSPTRRTQTKLERDLFWSLLNNPNRMPAGSSSRPSTSSVEPSEPNEIINLDSPVSNIQRLLAIKRLTHRLSAYRPNKTNVTCLHPVQRPPGSSRNIMPTMDLSATLKISRFKRRMPPRHAPPSCSRNSIIAAVMESPQAEPGPAHPQRAPPAPLSRAAPPVRIDAGINTDDQPLSDEEISPPARSESVDNTRNDENGGEQADVSANMSMEEVVDIDGDDAPAPAGDAERTEPAHASGDEDAHEEAAADATDAPAEAEQSHGVKRKRESQDEIEPYTVKEFNQSLLRLLECPVCLEWMEPPMSQCRRGHLVCGRCRARLAACPVCRTAFSSVRNRAMEAVAEMLRYPCRHGCGRETRLRRRAAHEASCAARRYRCPAPPCAERPPLPLEDMPHHFQSKHLSILKVGRKHKFSMKVNSEQHDNWLVMAARELFHLRVDVDIRTWGVVVYVAYIGPKCNATNYTYEVTVTGQHNDRKLVYTRATHSDLESSSLNVSRQDCFHLTLDQALNFLRFKNRHCEPDKFLDFVVEIGKRETPVENARDESDS